MKIAGFSNEPYYSLFIGVILRWVVICVKDMVVMDFQEFKCWFSEKWKKVVIWFIVITSIPVLLYIIAWFYIDNELNKRLNAIRAKGYPANSIELDKWYKAVPNNENMALELKKAFDLYVDIDDFKLSGELKKEKEKLSFANLFNKNKSFEDKIIIEGTAPTHPYLGDKLPKEIKEASELFLKANQPCLDKLHEALKLKKCRYPINLKNGLFLKLPHLAHIRELSRLLMMQSILAAENGDYSESIESIIDGFRLARSLNNEPTMMSYLVGNGCRSMILLPIEWLINKCELNNEQLKMLEVAMRDKKNNQRIKTVIIGEHAILDTSNLNTLLKYYGPLNLFRGTAPLFIHNFYLLIGKYSGIIKLNRIAVLDIMSKAIDIADSAENSILKSRYNKLTTESKEKYGWSLVLTMYLGSMDSYYRFPNRLHARHRPCRTMIAIEKYRLDNKKLPNSLQDLIPEYMDSLPIDPFDDKPLKYKKGEIEKYRFVKMKPEKSEGNQKKSNKKQLGFDLGAMFADYSKEKTYPGEIPDGMEAVKKEYPGYLIYSVGEKGKDNGGTPDNPRGVGSRSDITFTVIRQD